MYNHKPKNYIDPLELLVEGIENEHVQSRQEDIFYEDDYITAFISSHWWPNNPGHVIIIPNESIENIYDMSVDLLAKIHAFEKRVAIALKEEYKCDGVSSRQHNEPAGDQDVWHYHLHVFPRYENDNLYREEKRLTSPEEREPYAKRLRIYFQKH